MAMLFLVCLSHNSYMLYTDRRTQRSTSKGEKTTGMSRCVFMILLWKTVLLRQDIAGLLMLRMVFRADLTSKLALLCTRCWSRWLLEVPLHVKYPCGSTALHQRQGGCPLKHGRDWVQLTRYLWDLECWRKEKEHFENQHSPHLLSPKALTALIWGLKLYLSGCWKLQTEMSVLLEHNSWAPVNIPRFSSRVFFFYSVFHQ